VQRFFARLYVGHNNASLVQREVDARRADGGIAVTIVLHPSASPFPAPPLDSKERILYKSAGKKLLKPRKTAGYVDFTAKIMI